HTRFSRDWSSDVCSSDLAERVRPEPRALPDEEAALLDALLTRRRQIQDMITAEKNRLPLAPGPVQKRIEQHFRWLARQLDAVEQIGRASCREGGEDTVVD